MEKISSLAKDNKIKSLEELVLKIGYDTSNVKATEELLKKKNTDITSLRKQRRIPTTEDPEAKEMAETEGHKEKTLKLIIEQNAQIKEMEVELEKLVKEKEQSVPMTVILLQAVPIIGVSIVSTSPTAKIPSNILVTALNASKKLAKSMEDMSLQGQAIKRL
jgi:ParB-like chromosome segregation protein Spo0J